MEIPQPTVARDPSSVRNLSPALRALLLILGIAALALGFYGRFKGLGTWPLGVDEYYISRSIDNIFKFGIPHFSCGGYYTRGLIYQYLVAGMREIGGSREFDGRLLTALCTVAVLPATFLLARRLAGGVVAWVCVIILAISTWEIEMARFARMYAPFQAVFGWYLVFFLKYVIDRRKKALLVLAAFSVLGVLTWEGGVLLGAANLLAFLLYQRNERLSRNDWLRLALLVGLFGLLYFASKDLRGFAPPPPADDLSAPAVDGAAQGPLHRALQWLLPGGLHAVRLMALVIPLAMWAAALPWMRPLRSRPWSLPALLALTAAAVFHVFLGAALVLLLAHLMGMLTRHDYRRKGGALFIGALFAFLAGWILILWPLPAPDIGKLLFTYPNLYQEVLRPWGRTTPLLALELACGLAYWFWRLLRGGRAEPEVNALICLLILMLVAIGTADTDRLETRYTFFLFPLLGVLALTALERVTAGLPWGAACLIVIPVAAFAVTEDFSLGHIAAIDSAAINFRVGMSPAMSAHYYPRNDIRSAADWLRRSTGRDALLLSGVPNLAAYNDTVNFFFLRTDDDRYDTYVCPDGRTERWSNRPVIYGDDALAPVLESGRPVYLVMYSDFAKQFETSQNLARWSMTPVWKSPYGDTVILLLARKKAQAES